ncbi:MAG TPA: helix-turn-helix domain-containing GNAT family N-acetyltransferase [Terriglobales bacterium]|nr:helix-turn-helix domain-containing GNAT family N-acetyltransferase [Terriglobales bacterium]
MWRTPANAEATVEAVRRFNRFYTRRIGVLRGGVLKSPFSLTEVRVLYEVAHRSEPTAATLGKELGVDPGYLSRILRGFERRGILKRSSSQRDARQNLLSLTRQGRATFSELDLQQSKEVAELLRGLSPPQLSEMTNAMETIQRALGDNPDHDDTKGPYLLRLHQPGDMGWIVHRHAVLYSQEYGYDEQFEALVAEICAKFIQHLDPKRERCWIAERAGTIAGCVFLVKKSKTIAKLRLLLVEPSARGLGIGSRLVAECVRFARSAGYKKITLWTQSELHAARRIYEEAGFRRTAIKRHNSWGRRNLVAETWDLKL